MMTITYHPMGGGGPSRKFLAMRTNMADEFHSSVLIHSDNEWQHAI